MSERHQDDELKDIENDLLELLNRLHRVRAASAPRIAPDPWKALKDAARLVGKSEKVVWNAAQRTPGASWMHGKRRMVNMIKLPIKPPPG